MLNVRKRDVWSEIKTICCLILVTHLHLGLGKQAGPHFKQHALVLLHGSDGALDDGAGFGPALVQFRLELG